MDLLEEISDFHVAQMNFFDGRYVISLSPYQTHFRALSYFVLGMNLKNKNVN